jgi:hypothetical protein
MSSDVPRAVKGVMTWYAAAWVAGTIVGLIGLVFLVLGRPSPNAVQTVRQTEEVESEQETARQLLANSTDLSTCQAALNHVNAHFNQFPAKRPPPLSQNQAAELRRLAGLKADEVEEISGSNCTRLEAHHLEHCCLLRDAARSLAVRGSAGKNAGPGLDQASAAFDWVVRQVRSQGAGQPWAPPVLVLRRGWGTDMDRALIFLSLLEQVGSPAGRQSHLLGCLLFCPNAAGDQRFWACGVVVDGGKDVYLFDPRLGLALPGPGGKGVATLAEARSKPDVLAQLDVDKDRRYDVTADQARAAEVHLYCPLSALSPRMRHLQDEVLPPTVEVHLAADLAGDLNKLKAAAAAGADKETAVKVWPDGPGLVRRFQSVEDGGTDAGTSYSLKNLPGFTTSPEDNGPVLMTRQRRFMYEAVPWSSLPPDLQNLSSTSVLGHRVRNRYLSTFASAIFESGQPHDLLIRGRIDKAVQLLVADRDQWHERANRRAAARDVEPHVRAWVQRAFTVYATQLRARTPQEQEEGTRAVEQLWKDAEAVSLLIDGAMAGPRTAEITYDLGLCKHEQAERLQARLDATTRKAGAAPAPDEVEQVQTAWRDALGWWKTFAEQYAASPAQSAARRLRGRAQAMLGDRQGAVASWQDVSGHLTDPEKLASLYRARQLARQHEK